MKRATAGFVLGLLVGASPYLAGASQPDPAVAAPPDHLTGPPVVVENRVRDEEPEEETYTPPPADDASLAEAECAIDIMVAAGIDVSVEAVFSLYDWAEAAFGSVCAYKEAEWTG